MQGADRVGGWRNHFNRCERWQSRAQSALNDLSNTEFHEALDFALAYFVWCHSLRDWLLKDGALKRDDLDAQLASYPQWSIVRDVANRSKHLKITMKSKDAEWSMSREYDPLAVVIEGRERCHLNLFFDGKKHRLSEVVGLAGEMWRKILSDEGLI
ncbi:MAG: hypothetical protein CSA70_10545 [Rhodobacterales bacterium]|nr:MAG: hypothetical protein CSA70_10545 [Rhodobacterales bacterium]